MPMTPNATLAKLKRGDLALGLILRLSAGIEMAKVAKAADHDFLFIDMQHGAMSAESVSAICHAALDTGVTPLVRVTGHDGFLATRVLDNGALGVVVPDVETADEARAIVAHCRFAPEGRRSVGAGYPQLGYEALPTPEATRRMNAELMIVAMIESGRGLDNVEKIAAVPGLDALHIGTNDLLTEMGLYDKMGTEEHYALCARVIKACRSHGKHCGVGGARQPEMQAKFIAMGARMLTTNSELAFMIAAAGERARYLRQAKRG